MYNIETSSILEPEINSSKTCLCILECHMKPQLCTDYLLTKKLALLYTTDNFPKSHRMLSWRIRDMEPSNSHVILTRTNLNLFLKTATGSESMNRYVVKTPQGSKFLSQAENFSWSNQNHGKDKPLDVMPPVWPDNFDPLGHLHSRFSCTSPANLPHVGIGLVFQFSYRISKELEDGNHVPVLDVRLRVAKKSFSLIVKKPSEQNCIDGHLWIDTWTIGQTVWDNKYGGMCLFM